MTKLSLTPRDLVDLHGVEYRASEEQIQLDLTDEEMASDSAPIGFEDLGLVEYNGVEYYASILRRPHIEDEACE